MLGMDLGLNIRVRLLDIFFPGYLKIPDFGVIVLGIFWGWGVIGWRDGLEPHPSPLLGKERGHETSP
jgi:hypothetical protein